MSQRSATRTLAADLARAATRGSTESQPSLVTGLVWGGSNYLTWGASNSLTWGT